MPSLTLAWRTWRLSTNNLKQRQGVCPQTVKKSFREVRRAAALRAVSRIQRHVRWIRKPCAARFPCTFPRPRRRREQIQGLRAASAQNADICEQGKRVPAEKAAAGGLFRHAETGGALSPSGLRFRRPFRVPTEASSSLRVPLPDGVPAPEAGPAAFRRAGRFPSLGIRAQTDSPGNGAGSAPVRTTGGNAGPPAAAARLLRDGAACPRPDQA